MKLTAKLKDGETFSVDDVSVELKSGQVFINNEMQYGKGITDFVNSSEVIISIETKDKPYLFIRDDQNEVVDKDGNAHIFVEAEDASCDKCSLKGYSKNCYFPCLCMERKDAKEGIFKKLDAINHERTLNYTKAANDLAKELIEEQKMHDRLTGLSNSCFGLFYAQFQPMKAAPPFILFTPSKLEAKRKRINDEYEKQMSIPKDGDIMFNRKVFLIYRKTNKPDNAYYYSSIDLNPSEGHNLTDLKNAGDFLYWGSISAFHHASKEQEQFFFDTLAKQGLRWNAGLKKIEEIEKKRWRADRGEGYWTVDDDGDIFRSDEIGHEYDDLRWNFGNYFKTEEIATKARDSASSLYKSINNSQL